MEHISKHGDDTISVFDRNGRTYQISREVYRREILPKFLADAANDPDRLYAIGIRTLQDGFYDEALATARKLTIIEANERSANFLGLALMQAGLFDESQAVFENYLSKENSPTVMVNYAKLLHAQGRVPQADLMLRRVLKLDPNQRYALDLFAIWQRERAGREQMVKSLEEIARGTGSWYAKMLLARIKLDEGKGEGAITLYKDILSADSVAPDALMFISGDLASHGYLREAIGLVAPLYNLKLHGPLVGLNLAAAYIEQEDRGSAQRIIDAIEQLNDPEVADRLRALRKQLLKLV